MISTGTELVPGMFVTMICAARDRTLALFAEAFAKLVRAEQEAAKAARKNLGMLRAIDPHRVFSDLSHRGHPSIVDALRRRSDADAWGVPARCLRVAHPDIYEIAGRLRQAT